MTHRERILKVMRGEMVDVIPFVPRLDLWWLANVTRGTLPAEFAGKSPDDISRAEGWPVYHMVPAFADVSSENDVLHRSIGLYNFRQSVYSWRFPDQVEVKVSDRDGQQVIEYHTPIGMVSTVGGLSEEMKKAGASLGWVQEHLIKTPADYKVAGWLFEHIEVSPQYESALAYLHEIGDDGVVAAGGPSLGGSPMHMIQKELIDTTQFYYAYNDHAGLMQELAEKIGIYYDKVLQVIADSPAEVVLWGGNYDDMITYPPYFKKEISPWLQKVARVLDARGKVVSTHTDGENLGLMDLIPDSGVHLAESVTPYPMTKVKIEEYYARWREHLTIMGGIPESVLLRESTSEADFEAFMDHLFEHVTPGDRLILGTADSTPPGADFDRLRRIAERVSQEGRLPLRGRQAVFSGYAATGDSRSAVDDKTAVRFADLGDMVMDGAEDELTARVEDLLDQGVDASAILYEGLIPGMMHISEEFKSGEVFIPEVLLAARALNTVLPVLEPCLSQADKDVRKRVLIGTVQGDMHDIGKNIVAIMLRGAGFEVRDLGMNVALDEFVRQAGEFQPHVVALSALLTTTMPEMKTIIAALADGEPQARPKVMVGGAPVNQKFADDIGADGYADDAGAAVALARALSGIA